MATLAYPSDPLALAVLALLFERPMHPYEMAATLKQRHKGESIKIRHGSLYTVIELLVRRAFITAKETSREGKRPERTVYALSQSGYDELRSWMQDPLRDPVNEFPQFAAGLSLLPVLPPEEAVALLRHRTLRLSAEATRPARETAPSARWREISAAVPGGSRIRARPDQGGAWLCQRARSLHHRRRVGTGRLVARTASCLRAPARTNRHSAGGRHKPIATTGCPGDAGTSPAPETETERAERAGFRRSSKIAAKAPREQCARLSNERQYPLVVPTELQNAETISCPDHQRPYARPRSQASRIGANVAIKDAARLKHALVAAHRGEHDLVEAIHDYETGMLDSGFRAVRNSLKAMHQTVTDSLSALMLSRLTFRAINALPPVKRIVAKRMGEE